MLCKKTYYRSMDDKFILAYMVFKSMDGLSWECGVSNETMFVFIYINI